MKIKFLIIIGIVLIVSFIAVMYVNNIYFQSQESSDLRRDVYVPPFLREEMLEQLRKTPRTESMQNFTDTARHFVVSEVLDNPQVWGLLKNYSFQTECCSFSADQNEPTLNRNVGITFDVDEQYLFVKVTYSLEQEKVIAILRGSSIGLEIITTDESEFYMSQELLESYDFADVCGFPITDQTRLGFIYQKSNDFTNDGLSYLKLWEGTFTHVELSQYYENIYPSLEYWFTLRDGDQVYFKIGACDTDGSGITLGKPGPDYLKIKPGMYDNEYERISAPGFPLINTMTMQPVLDIDNCQGIAEYYTTLQSHTMFTPENVIFDPLWKDQVFTLMDYCNDVGNFTLEELDGKINWSFN